MLALRLTAIFATAAVSLSVNVTFRASAQSVTAPEADALRQSADELWHFDEDPAAVEDAYEQALRAYEALGDSQNALLVLASLFQVNYRHCEDNRAVFWAQQAIARAKEDRQRYHTYVFWVRQLGDLYRTIEQSEQALATYGSGIEYLEGLKQSADAQPGLWREQANLLRSQLGLPLSSSEVARLEARLVETREEIGAITQIEGLLEDARMLQGTAYASSELAAIALQNSQTYRYPAGELAALILLGEQAIAAGDYPVARRYGEQAISLAQQLPESETFQTEALRVWADSQRGLGNAETAITAYSSLLERREAADTSNFSEIREIVTTLVALYQATGQPAAARRLETDYASLLANPYSITLRPLPSRAPLPPIRRRSIISFRLCDLPAPSGSFPTLQPLPTLPDLPRPTARPARPSL